MLLHSYVKKILVLGLFITNTAVSFACLYLWLEITDAGYVIDHYGQHEEISVIAVIWKMVYFSIITMAAVGYGDLTPIGYAQPIATIQAIIGYLLPIIIVFFLAAPEEK